MSSSRASVPVLDRLLDAVTLLAGRDGYGQLTVEKVLVCAGVSRASFYQYFSDLDDCFVSAYRRHAEQLALDVEEAVSRSGQRELAMLEALVDAAIGRPWASQLLMIEGHASGSAGRSERAALVSRIVAVTGPARAGYAMDFPTTILVGAVFRFLSVRLSETGVTAEQREEVLEWAGAFKRHTSQQFWSAAFAPTMPAPASCPLPALGRARTGSPRERILLATRETVSERGYRAVAVADIVTAAGVSRRRFYNEFSSKAAASVAAYEQGFQRALAECAPAFFSSPDWPERIWQSSLAFAKFLVREPSFASFGFVECYTIGRGFASRMHDTQLAFTLFLEEGYRQGPQAKPVSRASSALIAATAAEIGYQISHSATTSYIRRMQPLMVYLALVPFLGPDTAGPFVADKLGVSGAAARQPKHRNVCGSMHTSSA